MNGKILDIIQAMFKAPNVSLLYKNKVTESLYTTIGLVKDDILSTIFFNFIYKLFTVIVSG